MHTAFEVTVLGTSSASPTKYRHPSAQFVRLEGDYFLLDCGEGTQLLLVQQNLRMHRIRYVFITHLHGDHYFGLPGLITSMALFGRKEPLTVFGPDGLENIINTILKAGNSHLPFEIEFVHTNPNHSAIILQNHYWQVESVPLKHRIPCTGFIIREIGPELRLNAEACKINGVPVTEFEKIKSGADYRKPDGILIPNHVLTTPGTPNRSYAYISDTIYDENVASYVSGADLLYHESTFLHEMKDRAAETFHTTALQAGMIAKSASVKKLILGHFSARYTDTQPLLDEAKTIFANTEIAEEGTTYSIG